MTSYASPDSFGSTPGLPVATNPADGIAYILGFDNSTVPPKPVWQLIGNWARAKERLGTTWADAKRLASTWAAAKAITSS